MYDYCHGYLNVTHCWRILILALYPYVLHPFAWSGGFSGSLFFACCVGILAFTGYLGASRGPIVRCQNTKTLPNLAARLHCSLERLATVPEK